MVRASLPTESATLFPTPHSQSSQRKPAAELGRECVGVGGSEACGGVKGITLKRSRCRMGSLGKRTKRRAKKLREKSQGLYRV